jgi:hypothetical protein
MLVYARKANTRSDSSVNQTFSGLHCSLAPTPPSHALAVVNEMNDKFVTECADYTQRLAGHILATPRSSLYRKELLDNRFDETWRQVRGIYQTWNASSCSDVRKGWVTFTLANCAS